MKKSSILKRAAACLTTGAMLLSAAPAGVANAAVIDPDHENNYDNFAEALQLALCFYDANKCGDEVADDGYYSWRANCHVKDGMIPLQPMSPMPTIGVGKSTDDGDQGLGTGDSGEGSNLGDDDPNLYIGVNMSQKFIDANIKYLDPDGDGCVDLTGGWHDAGDHVKFGLPGSYSASTVGWGYYEFRDAYEETGLQQHVEDELRWINDYFMKATFLDDDGHVVAYCYQVGEGNNDHNYWCPPELQVDGTVVASSSCAVKRPAYFATTEMPASDQCAGAAASLAINYLNFKDTDPEYAAENLKYALALYDFAVETHTEEWTIGTTPTATSLGYDGGFYTSSYDYDELAWAAVWLYYCTENYDYINDIIAVDETQTNEKGAYYYTGYLKRIMTDTGNCWQNIWVHCWDTVWGGVFAKLAPVTNTARDWYIFHWNLEFWSGFSEKTAEQLKSGNGVESIDEDGNVVSSKPMRDVYVATTTHKYFGMDDFLWNTPMTYDEIPNLTDNIQVNNFIAKSPNGWAVVSGYGSARYNTAAGLCAMVYAKETGNMQFAEWAKDQMEYILGENPMGYAYEVGYEHSYASQPHHRSSHCSPTQSMDDPVVQVHTLWGALVGGPDLNDFHSDVTKDYIYNEVTDDYNAAFCGDLAGLYHFYGAKGKELEDKNYIIPDFDMSANAAGYDQIDEDGNPLPTGLYVSGAKAQETDAGVQIKVVVHNRTIDPPQFVSDMKVRYYFNIGELLDVGQDIDYVELFVDYDQQSGYSNGETEATITQPIKYDDNGTYYVEIAWIDCDFYGSRVFQFRLVNKMDPETYEVTKWDSTNDYSYADLISFEDENSASAITDKITLYSYDELVWGVEPDGTSASDGSVLYGDANCDKEVKMSDAVLILQSIASPDKYGINGTDPGHITEQGLKNADCCDSDGVTSKDALSVQQYLLHLITLPTKST